MMASNAGQCVPAAEQPTMENSCNFAALLVTEIFGDIFPVICGIFFLQIVSVGDIPGRVMQTCEAKLLLQKRQRGQKTPDQTRPDQTHLYRPNLARVNVTVALLCIALFWQMCGCIF